MNSIQLVAFVALLLTTHARATQVRLVGGHTSLEGRVEIYHNGWGTICDDSFDTHEATVICRMLGFNGHATAYGHAHFGQGTGNILLDDLACTGRETDISQCVSKGWGVDNCSPSEDAGVRCSDIFVGMPKFIGGQGNFEGTVELDHGSLCDQGFTDHDATVLCRIAGFTDGKAVRGAAYGQLSYATIKGKDFRCHGNEDHIERCPGFKTAWNHATGCNHSMDAGVVCNHTEVRLVGGVLPSSGRLEILHGGVWGTVCGSGFSPNEAGVVCRMLGFRSSSGVVSNGVEGGSGPVWLDSVRCHGNESDIHFCNHGNWDNTSCGHSSDIGLTCTPTDVELRGGAGPWEGTLNVNLNGAWGTVCDPGFSDSEADVICRMLGYTRRAGDDLSRPLQIKYTQNRQLHRSCLIRTAPHTIYHTDFFSHTRSPIIDTMRCHGDETDISQCMNNFHTTCSTRQTVGLKCEGLQVRLVGGAHSSEGRVEILHGSVWGTICDDGWDDVDATVICKMLSSFPFDGEVTGTSMPGSYFGYGTGPVFMSRAACNGSESGISGCQADWTGGVNCDHSRDAGVLCDFHRRKQLGGSNMSHSGTVLEVYQGVTRGYCPYNWNNTDGAVICRELGYIAPQAVVYENRTHGVTSSSINTLHPDCSGSEGHLEMCPLVTRLGQYTCALGTHEVGVDCNPRPLSRQEVRLVDGPGPWKGRLEVLGSQGSWGSFSHSAWNSSHTDMVCRQLGFRSNVTSYPASKGLTSLLYRGMDCAPGETNIGTCRMDYNTSSCKTATCPAVGLDCSGTNGISAKLSNGTRFSGDVMIFTNNNTRPWSVCHDGIDNTSARVICSMTGYTGTHARVSPSLSQNHVLFSSVRCAGWETHVAQCVLSQNNTSCDDKAAVTCFDTDCTVSDSRSSGSAVSPHYPSPYPRNKDCMYVITPPANGGAYKLVFHDLNLDGDGDFVEVRDGPHGRQLGNFSIGSNVPYLVSNNSFYIRFKTNANGASSRGFNVSWSPLSIEDAVTMGCGQHGWDIAVNTTILRHLYPDTGVSQIKLTDQLCTGVIDGDLLRFRQSYTGCSTHSQSTSSNVKYTNSLLYPEAASPFPLIVHGYRWKVEVECDITRGQTIVHPFHPNQTISNSHQSPHVGSSANYATTVKYFKDGSFYTEITGNPVSLQTGSDVFVQVKMDSDDSHVKMILDTCWAKPNPTAGAAMTYTLINNGCVSDRYTQIISQGTHETRFAFNAFEFPTNHDAVYVYCNTTFCPVTDTSSPCTQTCHVARPSLVGRAVELHVLYNADD